MNTSEALRHFLAALAYRLQKAIRGAPEEYWAFEPGQGVRDGRAGLAVLKTAIYDQWVHLEDLDWKGEVERIHATLEALDHELTHRSNLTDNLLLRLLQGPFPDAMTYIGQLATLRRRAEIRAGQLGPDQPARAKRRLRI